MKCYPNNYTYFIKCRRRSRPTVRYFNPYGSFTNHALERVRAIQMDLVIKIRMLT